MTYRQLYQMLKRLSDVQLDSEVVLDIPDEPPKPIHFEVVEHGGNISLGLPIVKITEQPKCSFCGDPVPHSRMTTLKNSMYVPYFPDHCRKPDCSRQSAHRYVEDLIERAKAGDVAARERLDDLAADFAPNDDDLDENYYEV